MSKYLRPWSVVDDQEIKLLRRLREVVSEELRTSGVSPRVHAILGMLDTTDREK